MRKQQSIAMKPISEKWVRYTLSVRGSIESGDLYYTSSRDLYSRIIQLVTKSDISHVGIFYWLGGRLFTIECNTNGCTMIPASNRFKGKVIIQRTGMRPKASVLMRDVGRVSYDWLGVILSPFVRLQRSERYCAEFVEDSLGVFLGPTDRNVYPVDVYQHFNAKEIHG